MHATNSTMQVDVWRHKSNPRKLQEGNANNVVCNVSRVPQLFLSEAALMYDVPAIPTFRQA